MITCPECGVTSHHPDDEAEGYCVRCGWWTANPMWAAMWRERWPEKAAQAHKIRDQSGGSPQ